MSRDPAYAKGHLRLGATQGALGNWPAAVEAYTEACRLEPGNAATATALKQVGSAEMVGRRRGRGCLSAVVTPFSSSPPSLPPFLGAG